MLTNDGNAILREIDVSHPAAKVSFRGSTFEIDIVSSSSIRLDTLSVSLTLHAFHKHYFGKADIPLHLI